MNTPVKLLTDLIVPFGLLLRNADTLQPYERWPEVLYRFIPLSFLFYWLFYFIPVVGGMIYMLGMVPLSILAHRPEDAQGDPLYFKRRLLLYLTVILIGFGGIWSFVGHIFMAQMVASQIGWEVSPFQTELAFYTLGTSMAAMLAIWIRGHLITALVLAKSIFWYGAAYVHIREAVLYQNFEPLNIGGPLVGDLIYPTVMLYLLWQLRDEMDRV